LSKKNSQINSEVIELTIDSLSYHGGRGVGRYEGIVVFVGGTVPQDVVRARVVSKKSRLWEAELVEVLKPSPFRREPPCPVAGRCGGCAWQQVSYDQQIVQKEKILADALRGLRKHGGWENLPFLRAPSEFHYRNRIQVHFKGGQKGFFASRTRDLVPIEKCWIAEEGLNEKLRGLSGADGAKVEISLSEGGDVFAQVNTAQNGILKSRLIDFISIEPDWILDLYAGSGNLTKPLAEKFPGVELTAIEFSRASVKRGRELLPSVNWVAADTGEGLKQIKKRDGPGLIVLDPPRTGVSQQVCDHLLRLAPQQIVYVSCNPSTFARDVEKLVGNKRYRLAKVQGLDMFPQTEHVELIALLCSAT
jgi:23S rRNA (uracil1939-C5)-methyltransferase